MRGAGGLAPQYRDGLRHIWASAVLRLTSNAWTRSPTPWLAEQLGREACPLAGGSRYRPARCRRHAPRAARSHRRRAHRSPAIGVRRGADQPYQRRAADCARQPAGQPGASPAAQRHGHHLQNTLQTACPPTITNCQARHLLREGGLRAGVVAPEVPAGLLVSEDFLAAARGISHLPLVAAVHPPRHHAAARAGRLAARGVTALVETSPGTNARRLWPDCPPGSSRSTLTVRLCVSRSCRW
jgi:hypothetical protein